MTELTKQFQKQSQKMEQQSYKIEQTETKKTQEKKEQDQLFLLQSETINDLINGLTEKKKKDKDSDPSLNN